uniref:hypothetical protein n=1 Tax=uncultured Rhizobium sp. TaxID=155567 RepID=UPI002618C601
IGPTGDAESKMIVRLQFSAIGIDFCPWKSRFPPLLVSFARNGEKPSKEIPAGCGERIYLSSNAGRKR